MSEPQAPSQAEYNVLTQALQEAEQELAVLKVVQILDNTFVYDEYVKRDVSLWSVQFGKLPPKERPPQGSNLELHITAGEAKQIALQTALEVWEDEQNEWREFTNAQAQAIKPTVTVE